MTDVDVTLRLPEELVTEARTAGLLTEERIAGWLKNELERKRHIAELRDDVRKLRALEPALTSEENAEEIS